MGHSFQRVLSENLRMTLQERMAREFGAAKRCWIAILLLQVVLLAVSLGSLWMTSFQSVIAVGIFLLSVPAAILFLKWGADAHSSRGESLRRAFFLQNSLGSEPDAFEIAVLESEATHLTAHEPASLGAYFQSTTKQGVPRLVENLQESAFYTRRLARLTSRLCLLTAITGGLLALFVLYVGVQLLPSATSHLSLTAERIARVFYDLYGLFFVGSFIELLVSYSVLSQISDEVYRNCCKLRAQPNIKLGTLLSELSKYDCALARANPIPGFVKRLCGRRLFDAWAI